jgi:hypothetical protein
VRQFARLALLSAFHAAGKAYAHLHTRINGYFNNCPGHLWAHSFLYLKHLQRRTAYIYTSPLSAKQRKADPLSAMQSKPTHMRSKLKLKEHPSGGPFPALSTHRICWKGIPCPHDDLVVYRSSRNSPESTPPGDAASEHLQTIILRPAPHLVISTALSNP